MQKLLSVFLLLLFCNSYAQQNRKVSYGSKPNQELGLSLGLSNYLGDLAWNGKIPIISESNPRAFRGAAGVFYRNNFTRFSSIRVSLAYGQLVGNDSQTNFDPARINRNLSFRSPVLDASFMFEWNIIPYQIGDRRVPFTPYLGIGIAGFYFNPKALLNGRFVALQPLGTEGQGILEGTSRYSLLQLSIPGSAGFKINVSKRVALGFEFQYRLTFTDYIDDVSSDSYVSSDLFYDNYINSIASDADALAFRALDPNLTLRESDQRGDPRNNDNYYFYFVNISYKLGQGSVKCPTFK